jgi:hypothetical protein
MLGDHVSIVARRGIQQREADILLAVGFGKFVGAGLRKAGESLGELKTLAEKAEHAAI